MHIASVTWYTPAERLPDNHACVLGAMAGNYADGKPYRVVLPMFFYTAFWDEEADEIYENCFIDDDGVMRFPTPRPGHETIDFWMNLPPYPTTD